MKFELVPKESVWTPRGRRRREIPEQIKQMADATYRTDNVGMVTIEPGEETEGKELVFMLRAYAKSRGRHIRIQNDDGVLKFELCDLPRKAA